MEQHPIPQDIKSYEFHLIGDMTLRQFGYLASGLASAYVTFIVFSKQFPLVAWPLIVIFAALGVAFAFLPIMERPLDHWVRAFFAAIFRPTQMKFKSKVLSLDNPYFEQRLNFFLQSLSMAFQPPVAPSQVAAQIAVQRAGQQPVPAPRPVAPAQPAPQVRVNPAAGPAPVQPLTNPIPAPLQPAPVQPQQPKPDVALPSKEELKKTVALAKEAQEIQGKIITTEEQLNKIKLNAAQPGIDPKYYSGQFQEVLSNLQDLNKEAGEVSEEIAKMSDTPASPYKVIASRPVKPSIIPSLTLTSVPNMVNGIVTDSMGNYVEGAIVVAHDKQGLPVRALKSNKLGQFIAATPLGSGIYTMTIEKDNMLFDTIEVELKDQVMKPIVVSARKQGVAI